MSVKQVNLRNLQRKLFKRIRVSFAQDSLKCQNWKIKTVGIWIGERSSCQWLSCIIIQKQIILLKVNIENVHNLRGLKTSHCKFSINYGENNFKGSLKARYEIRGE